MSTEDAFVHAILNDPDDDTARLVFADWLEEHDRESHAELIRVQCELARMPKQSREPKAKARRAQLAAREKELLRQPEFFPTWPEGLPKPWYDGSRPGSGAPKQKYERGFIAAVRVLDNELMAPGWARSPRHALLREGKILAVELQPDQGGFVSVDRYSARLDEPPPEWLQVPQVESQPAPGGVPHPSSLDTFELAGHFYEMADLARHPVLCRVTRLHLFEADLTDDNLGVLARSPLLTQLREIWLGDCTISLDAMRAVVASPSIKRLRELFMEPAHLAGARRGRGIGQLWELVASSPNMASLEHLWIDSLDNKVVGALIKSPYLKESLRICSSGYRGEAWQTRAATAGLSTASVKALRQRFLGTPF
ncbi:Repeat-companion domain TIGR02996 OS=Singulisphaera acidiphila (strain ATCC BAA-1392 / DSM 18658 / VKM B-2454 / MOB10) GN=Sinac_4455 PE=4 SV=1 [Gemmata massiliana]|uniref:Repeat-companion domain TIGR02996 n=1 Tax=Gemmata massiliana TaxID=1210884 RepID=A0A6P2D5B3_9BACT|nr:TIGR02996 domain-containing protein [Gemmata massiliana]VTR96253.1 Repeat-companion domain TIGR02996 OS=Singulisphaera acidiphila (strain ATCC BAA-1392 / DSM 18658 / VKM B-2454 / MOB10) GN=Sinac_4455 PE=4 SV=1 [Gemmata massiliana]